MFIFLIMKKWNISKFYQITLNHSPLGILSYHPKTKRYPSRQTNEFQMFPNFTSHAYHTFSIQTYSIFTSINTDLPRLYINLSHVMVTINCHHDKKEAGLQGTHLRDCP